MQVLVKVLGLKELGILVGAVISLGFISSSLATALINQAGFQNIVAIARAIELGQAIPQAHWNGGIVPYVWGGGHASIPGPTPVPCDNRGPTSCICDNGEPTSCIDGQLSGVDCSGFVRWVYSIAFGSDVLNGVTTTQIALPTLHPVSAAAALPGDLVFFGTVADPHHVGIYIGNGQMINALKPGTNVETDPLLSDLVGYYHYQGASFSVVGPPTVSATFIDQVLAANNSPAYGTGELFYDYGVQYGIDPVFALAFFKIESSFGTAGVARNTLSIGNIVCTPTTPADMRYESNGHCFQMYHSWAESIASWYSLIRNSYVDQWHLSTINQIIPKYAPSSDGNSASAYIAGVEQSVMSWRSGNPEA